MHTQAEFGVVLEERVRPCRALALVVGAVRGRRCRTRIDRGAARGVGNHHLVAEQLRDSLDIGSLAAAGAGTRELEQGLCELEVLHRLGLVDDLLVADVPGDVLPILLLGHLLLQRAHHQRLLLGRADVHAVRAARTVERRDLDAELVLLGLAQPLLPFHARCGGLGLRREERTDHGVRADIGALVALDTVLDLPLGDIHGDAALLVGGRAVLPRTVLTARESRYRQVIALQPVDRLDDLAHELGIRRIRNMCEAVVVDLRPFGRHLDLHHGVAAGVDGRIVHVDDVLALLAVGFQDGMLHLVDSLVERDDVGDLEECRLHDGIRTRTQSELGGDLRGVDDIEIDLVLGQIGFHMVGQRGAGGSRVVHRVEQERTAGFQPFQHVVLVDVRRHVAGHEVGRGDQVGRSDRQVAETQVRRGVTARLLRVVREICLAIFVRRAADDLDRVLVGAYRTVRPQAEEQRLECTGLGERNLLAHGQRAEGHVVHDAHRKLVLGLVGPEVGEHGQHLRRRGVFGRKAVAAADDERFAVGRNILAVGECLDDIQVERVAVGSRFLRTVEHADALHRFGQHLAQVFHRERAVEVYRHDAHLPATGVQVVDRLPEGFGHRPHRDHDVLGVRSSVIYERLVLAAGDLRNLAHRLGNHVGHDVIETVGGLAGLEIDVGVLRRTAGDGVLGVERPPAELSQRIAVEHGGQGGLVDQLDLLDLVRGTEAVEEVQERHARFERHDVRHARQIHHLLYRRGGQHGEPGLAGGHDVLVVSENRQRLCGQRTRRDVEHARQQFAGDLIHIGDHQQQTLRRGERRRQGTALQRTVHGACGTGFGLHLDNFHRFAENIFATLCGPLVHEFGHGRRRRDGIDRRNFREHVCNMCRSVVTITSDKFLFCHFVEILDDIVCFSWIRDKMRCKDNNSGGKISPIF